MKSIFVNTIGKLHGALAAAVVLAAFSGSVRAIDPASYKAKLDKARTIVSELLEYTAAAESGERFPGEELAAAGAIREALPASETVEWRGQQIETSNQWIHERLGEFENEEDSTKRAVTLTEIDELLSALSAKLSALDSAAEGRAKDDDKRKLAEILARDEYQKPVEKKESGIAGLVERFLNWLRGFFPESGPAANSAYDFSSIAKVLQVLLFALIIGALAFVIYKFAPLLFPTMRRGKRVKKTHRTILGERIGSDESSADLFSEAERLAREGEIRAAIRKGYVAFLCELSDKNVIALEQHKTNRDYLRDVRGRQTLYGNMSGLTLSFERHWYGLQPTGENDWDSFRETYKKAVADV